MSGRSMVLVLNASYEPVQTASVRRAVVLVLKGAATIEARDAGELRSARAAHAVPAVIRLTAYRRIPRGALSASRRHILLRDRNTCQYCARVLRPAELTLDHVLPRSRGGASTWENLVACCHACNRRKADRTPDEARMALHRRPRRAHRLVMWQGAEVSAWRPYLFA